MLRSGFAILLTMPTAAHASGGDALGLFWAQAGLFLLVVVSFFVVRLSSPQKTVVFSAYLISGIVANYATLNLPYSANATLIDSVSAFVPLLVWIVALGYFVMRVERNITGRRTRSSGAALRVTPGTGERRR